MDQVANRGSAAILAGLLALATGCCTAGKLAPISVSGPGWQIRQGQAVWTPSRDQTGLGGELLVASHQSGIYVFDFEKTPLPVTKGQVTSTNWLIQFPAQKRSLGSRGPPPARFAWLYLGAALQDQPLPKPLRFEREPEGRWRLENTRSGETIEGFLTP